MMKLDAVSAPIVNQAESFRRLRVMFLPGNLTFGGEEWD